MKNKKVYSSEFNKMFENNSDSCFNSKTIFVKK
ncbi:hypothetical protein X925_04135 [Petrotoga sp. 9T1HF07.CasAA.8.2]|nr:hypothetical protein X925_04135 [Petrotoga sp. 9T1HF07.CasAA.8.2]